MKRLFLFFSFILTLLMHLQAQTDHIARSYLEDHKIAWNLEASDIAELSRIYAYTSEHNGVTHAYFIQQYQGIPVHNAIYNVNIKDGKVIHAGNRLVEHIAEKVSTRGSVMRPEEAVMQCFGHLGLQSRTVPGIREKRDQHHVVFESGDQSFMDIPVQLVYAPAKNGMYTLAWDIMVEPRDGQDIWSIRLDASSGQVLDQVSFTTHCTFPHHFLAKQEMCPVHRVPSEVTTTSLLVGDGATYHAVAFPFESPIHGARELIVDPADPVASPYGWHDLDGAEGNETTVTRGNNVHAYVDRDGDQGPDGDDVDGGEALMFDFPFDEEAEPIDYQEAAVTNLFYANNYIHDFAFHYGFTEEAGNFQEVNMSNKGIGSDYVMAMAQHNSGTTNPSLNNANFGTPPDGGNGRMRMFVWEGSGANKLLKVNAPAEIAGSIETSTANGWGAAITSSAVTAPVVIANDGTGQATQGCNDYINAEEVNGHIALIDRGTCEFGRKALNAQNAGAIGVIICNYEEGLVNMGAGAVGDQVTIPVVFIKNSDCQRIRIFANNALEVSLVNASAGTGPNRLDASFDNGVIAHEYAHGISNRLTGGPTFAGCLRNYDNDNDGETEDGEQMGEGWSDFFTLITSVQPGDVGETPRGIGTYVSKQEVTGGGIRPYPYSTDMTINPVTYDDIAFLSVPHGVGSVWCSILWDLYWKLVEKYGFDADLMTGSGGNNLAVQLVVDGMKFQTCNPGFADGRDAILTADLALTGGENQKLIWEVFARRGVGYSSEQGEDRFRHDNSEAFDVNPFVIKELKVVKKVTPVINPGDEIEVEVLVINHKDEAASDVVLSDALPDETTFVSSQSNPDYTIDGNNIVFELGSVLPGDTSRVTYLLASNPGIHSPRLFYDDMEDGDFKWDIFFDEGNNFWTLQDFIANSGSFAWAVENIDTTSDQGLQFLEPVLLEGDHPILRFTHQYNTERFFDAGIIQVSTDNGFTWDPVTNDKVFRGRYSGKIQYGLFAIPNLKGFHGESEEWVTSYADLSDYAGEEVLVRFRFGSDGNTSGLGWFVDDVEILNAFSYNSEACVTSAEGDAACAMAPDYGSIVNYDLTINVDDPEELPFTFGLFPNPASDYITVTVGSKENEEAEMTLMDATGRAVWTNRLSLNPHPQTIQIRTDQFARGFYFFKVSGETSEYVRKLILK